MDRKSIADIVALTPLQEGMLFHYLKDPESDIYFEQLSLEIAGEIDFELFEKAWNFVIETNEMLRAVFRWEKIENPLQIILKKHQLQPKFFDLSGKESREKKKCIEKIKVEDKKEKFDLREVPFRVTLCKVEENKYEIMISNHHILYDGWSNGIILKEFFTIYNDLVHKRTPQKPIKSKFKEFVKWLNNQDQKQEEKFWKDYLTGFDIPTVLPVKRTRTKVNEITPTGNLKITFPGGTREQLERFIRLYKLTMAGVLYSAWGILLQKYNNCHDVVFGTTVSGRSARVKGIENMVGLFINTLPLRVQQSPNSCETILELLIRMNETLKLREAYEHTSLMDIIKYIQWKPRGELFDSLLVMENYPLDIGRLQAIGPLSIPLYSLGEMTHYDLTLVIRVLEEIEINLFYPEGLFTQGVIEQLFRNFTHILQDVVENPLMGIHVLEMLSVEEKQQLLVDFNNTDADYPKDKTIHRLFEEQVEQTADKIALVSSRQYEDALGREVLSITYKELNQRSNQLARLLCQKGVQSDTIAAIMAERSLEVIVGIMAIIKAGGAYLPIDPEYPQERIQYILDDSGASLLLTVKELQTSGKVKNKKIYLDQQEVYRGKADNLKNVNCSANLAYIIYTSGTTGMPKGVMVEHMSVVNILSALQNEYPLKEDDAYLLKTSYIFDVSVTELFGCFLEGGRLVVLEKHGEKDPYKILDTIERTGITHINFVPSMFNSFVEVLEHQGIDKLYGLRYIFLAGEALLPEVVNKFRQLDTGIQLENIYGPTEGTIYSSKYPVSGWNGSGSIPIGEPMRNIKLFILDRDNQLQPVGVPGELCIAGLGLARGYLNQPEMTAQKFQIPNSKFQTNKAPFEQPMQSCIHASMQYHSPPHYPIPPLPQFLIYRTGDLARWLTDGNIEFLGRIDHQVKIRGFRIELGEIENQLLTQGKINEAIVLAREDKNDKYLCAYVVAQSKETTPIDSHELREYLSHRLPDYMVPSYFVVLEEMPLTNNGKVDRKALPKPDVTWDKDHIPPRNEIENMLAEIWAQVLGIDKKQISIHDNFFLLGGHSLKAAALSGRIYKALAVKIPISELFERPTLEGISRYIARAKETRYLSIEPVEEKEYYPLSSPQKRLSLIYQMSPPGIAYNLTGIKELQGKLEKKRFEECFSRLIARHESLRTSFEFINGEPVQEIHRQVEFEIEFYQVEVKVKVEEIINHFVRPFDLSQAPLLRVGLIKIEEEKHLLLLDMHHIISDGVSIGIFIKEFTALYRGGESLPDLYMQYKDFSHWQNKLLVSPGIKKQEAYWLHQFDGDIPILELPLDYPRPSVQQFVGNQVSFKIGEEKTRELNRFIRENDSTLFIVLLAVFSLLLSKLSSQQDIVVGTPTAGRSHHDLEKLIGMFVNTLALRIDTSGSKTLSEFIKDVRKDFLTAFENQDYPYEDLVDRVVTNVTRDLSRNPLFDVMVVVQNMEMEPVKLPGLKITPYEYNAKITKFDLTLICIEIPGNLEFTIEYSSKLFNESTIQRYIIYFKELLSGILADKNRNLTEIEIIPEKEKHQILFDFNDTQMEYPGDKTLHELFEEVAAGIPHHVSVVGSSIRRIAQGAHRSAKSAEERHDPYSMGGAITYRELNKNANQLAYLLKQKGIKSGTIVAMMMPRSVEIIVGMLAILKAGGAYLPIDPGYPEERIRYMLEDSAAEQLIGMGRSCDALNPGRVIDLTDNNNYNSLSSSDPEKVTIPKSLLYVIYTSGSTGRPKGAAVKHSGFVNLVYTHQQVFKEGPGERMSQVASPGFDAMAFEVWPCLLNSGTLFIAADETRNDPRKMKEWLIVNKITISFQPTIVAEHLLMEEWPEKGVALRALRAAGEQLTRYPEPHHPFRLYNLYGPTEDTVWTTWAEVEVRIHQRSEKYPFIGQPIANHRVYIMGPTLKLQPIGVPGEVCIAGEGLAVGYLNRTELTSEKFVEDPLVTGERMYKSGDLARWVPGDKTNIEFLGRRDQQVKIRGFRIELGEIEKNLMQHHGINDAVVIAAKDKNRDQYLSAYIVAEHQISSFELRDYLTRQLPDYMIPSHFIRLEQIPLTSNGKLDREALPKIEGGRQGDEYVAPRDEIEARLATIWEEELGIKPLGAQDNFFHCGGHSLKALQVISRIHKAFGVEIRIRDIFQYPTISSSARLIKNSKITGLEIIETQPQRAFYEMSYSQKRLWYIYKREPDNTGYNMPVKITLYEEVDEVVIQKVLEQLMTRHESLRTSFKEINKEPVQVIEPLTQLELNFEVSDRTQLDAKERENRRSQLLMEESKYIFKLEKAPLFRAKLVKWNAEEFDFIFNIHHIISDGWSLEILLKEFERIYQAHKKGITDDLEPLPIQYKEFAAWQNKLLANEENIGKAKKFWKSYLNETLAVLNLPYDTSPGLSDSRRSAAYRSVIPGELVNRLEKLALGHRASLFMVLLAGFNIMLSKITGQKNIIMAIPAASRQHEALKVIVGMFVNTLILQTKINTAETFTDFFNRFQGNTFQVLEYQSYPMELIFGELKIKYPDISVFFNMINIGNSRQETLEDVEDIHIENVQDTKFHIHCYLREYKNGIEISCHYFKDLFMPETVEKMMKMYLKTLEIVSDEPGKIIAKYSLTGKKKRLNRRI